MRHQWSFHVQTMMKWFVINFSSRLTFAYCYCSYVQRNTRRQSNCLKQWACAFTCMICMCLYVKYKQQFNVPVLSDMMHFLQLAKQQCFKFSRYNWSTSKNILWLIDKSAMEKYSCHMIHFLDLLGCILTSNKNKLQFIFVMWISLTTESAFLSVYLAWVKVICNISGGCLSACTCVEVK